VLLCLNKQPRVVLKLIKLVYHELNIFFALFLPDARFQKPLVFTGFGKVNADKSLAGNVSEMPVEFGDDFRCKGAYGVAGLFGLAFSTDILISMPMSSP
jgi:hypothetical protein